MKFSLQTDPGAPSPPPSTAPAGLPSPAPGRPSRPRVRPSGVIKGLAIAGVVAGAGAIALVPAAKRPFSALFASTKVDVITAPVRPGKLAVIVKERGSLESAANKDTLCEVEGGTTIIKILPEGTPVKEGDLVCELDSASLRDTLTTQKITTTQADASYQQAKLVREVAEYAVREYEEGVFKQDKATAEGEIALAKADLERAVDRLAWSTKMLKKDYVSAASQLADKLSLDRATFDLEQAQTQLDVLLKYTKDKQIKSLRSDVEKAKADELSKESSWSLEKTKEAKLERQIKACILKAPGDGIVVYANDPNKMGGGGGQQQVQIEEGASVRERQKIFSLPDVTKMRVNTKVHESMVEKVKPGLRALVRVEAAAGQAIPAVVDKIAPMADSGSFFASDIKVYTTYVAIEGDTTKLHLRPGMNAQVEILVTELPDVLSVPVQAILQFKDKDYVFARDGDGFRRVEVELGVSNDQHVEVKKGLKDGDAVAMSPTNLLTEDERREAFSVASKDAAKKDFGGPAGKGAPGAGGPGTDGPGGDGAPKAKAKGKRAGGGMAAMLPPELAEKFGKISPDDRPKLFSGTDEEKAAVLKGVGFTDGEIEQFNEMRRNMPAGGRGGRPGGGGGPGGGPGGGGGGPGQ